MAPLEFCHVYVNKDRNNEIIQELIDLEQGILLFLEIQIFKIFIVESLRQIDFLLIKNIQSRLLQISCFYQVDFNDVFSEKEKLHILTIDFFLVVVKLSQVNLLFEEVKTGKILLVIEISLLPEPEPPKRVAIEF